MRPHDFAVGERVEIVPMRDDEVGLELQGSTRGFVIGHRGEAVIVRFEDPGRFVDIGHLPDRLRKIDVVETLGELDAPSA